MRRLAFGGALVALLFTAASARAQVRTCVEIESPARDREALTRAVKTELDRHPTHHAADSDCQGTLTVEIIDLGATDGRWVTGRINSQVPDREKVGPDGLVPAVERLLRVVLHNDPLVLQGPGSQSWLERQRHALEVRTAMHWGLEVYEAVAPLGSSIATLPGFGLSLRREASALYVGARLGGAFDPDNSISGLQLRLQIEAQLEAGFYASPEATTSFFASALVGALYQRFEGPAPLDGADATGAATMTGVAVGARAGVEAMRASDVRVLAFLQLQLPAFASSDPDHGVVDRWVPSASIGAGLLF
ncbi:MAG TPA: hypothetical protein VHK47_06010 [Polyangia bacterium]|jgi:hypothetical protein|nr:hypothetical protein [Polyangia bacterium]